MSDDNRIWNDAALERREGQERPPTPVQRIPPRLVGAVLAAGINGVLTAVSPFGQPVLVLIATLAAAITGGAYVRVALRHASLVVIPMAVTTYVIEIVFLLAVGAGSAGNAARLLPAAFLGFVIVTPFVLVASILWAAIARSFEDRLFAAEFREESRESGSSDRILIGGWAAVAVVWAIISLIAFSMFDTALLH